MSAIVRPAVLARLAPSVLRRLASLKLTLGLIAWLAIAVLYAHRETVSASWSIALPLAALAINLAAAVVTNPVFRRQTALLVFHLALIALAVLIAAGRLIELRGRAEVTQGAAFDGRLIEVDAGPLHPWRLERAAFVNDGFEIDYGAGVKRGPTRNRVRWHDTRGEQRAVVGDHVPLVLAGYRFYTSPNKGFAVRLTWRPAAGASVPVVLHFPAYPVFQFGQTLEWNLPRSSVMLKLKLDLPDKLIDPDAPSRFAMPREHRLTIDDGADVRSLAAGGAIAVAGGVLVYDELTTWMGYSVLFDPTTPWLAAACAVALGALAWHFWRKFAARPWQPE